MFPEACFVKMYYFAIEFVGEMPYPLAPPQGWEAVSVFENLAASNWQLAKTKNLNHKDTKEHKGVSQPCAKLRWISEVYANLG